MEEIPRHVAIIADGNRRWATEKGLPSFEGHRRGAENVKVLSRAAKKMGITVLTFWVFSTENWKRTVEEVGHLMKLFEVMIEGQIEEAIREKTRIIHLGRKDRIPHSLKNKIIEAEEKTKQFSEFYLAIALDYGGRDEIVRAVEQITKAQENITITEAMFDKALDTKDLPHPGPDLIIRTSGEYRMSGFMLWQSQYSEFMFCEKMFPDFNSDDLASSLREYKQRKRRFGK